MCESVTVGNLTKIGAIGFHSSGYPHTFAMNCHQSMLGWVCLGTGFGFAPQFLAQICVFCGWAWVLPCTPPFLAGVLGRA